MRGLCSFARALVLAAALVVMSSCSDVADGVRTAPSSKLIFIYFVPLDIWHNISFVTFLSSNLLNHK